MDVLCTRIVCHQLFRDDYRDLVVTGGALDQGLPDHGLFRNHSICRYAFKGASRSARGEENSPPY